MTAPWTDLTNFGSLANVWQKRSLLLKGEKCSGGKHSEACLNGLAAGNGYVKMILKFVEENSKNPRCFKGVKRLPCWYHAQRKSSVSSEIFEEWVRELTRKLVSVKRENALIIQFSRGHPPEENLEGIELIFLPANTTPHTQPMKQGITCVLKVKYRSLAIRKLISALEKKEQIPAFSILSAIIILGKTLNAVSNNTFFNYFKKAGISEEKVLKFRFRW